MKTLVILISTAMIAMGSVTAMASSDGDKAKMEEKAMMAEEAAKKEKMMMAEEAAKKKKMMMAEEAAKKEKMMMAEEAAKKEKMMMAEEAAKKEKMMMAEEAAKKKKAMMAAEAGDYVIKRGDNLWNIAKARYGSGAMWIKIKDANKISSGGRLTIGDTLMIPK